MIIYWILFALPGIFYVTERRFSASVNQMFWVATAAVFAFFIGFRHEVGCDWYGYYSTYEALASYTYSELFTSSGLISRGLAFYVLSHITSQTSFGFYGFNFVCGIFLCWGLFYFCSRQPYPWLACLIAVPYLVIVVSMGYVRQSIAIGFLFFALNQLAQERHWRYSVLIVSGALFHTSLALLFPLVLISLYKKNRSFFVIVLVLILFSSIYAFNMYGDIWNIYFSSDLSRYVSKGALPRALLNAIPAVILLFISFQRRSIICEPVWLVLAVLSILFVVIVQIGASGFDRLALYLLPIQLYAWPKIIELVNVPILKRLIACFVIMLYGGYQYIWLNFSDHAGCWMPYLSILF